MLQILANWTLCGGAIWEREEDYKRVSCKEWYVTLFIDKYSYMYVKIALFQAPEYGDLRVIMKDIPLKVYLEEPVNCTCHIINTS